MHCWMLNGAIIKDIRPNKLPIYQEWVENLSYFDVLRLLDFSFKLAPSMENEFSIQYIK